MSTHLEKQTGAKLMIAFDDNQTHLPERHRRETSKALNLSLCALAPLRDQALELLC